MTDIYETSYESPYIIIKQKQEKGWTVPIKWS